MKKNKKSPRLRGLGIPRTLIYCKGIYDSWCNTAHIDKETQLVTSAYVNAKRFLFDEYTKQLMIEHENELSALRTEARALVLELESLVVTRVTPVGEQVELPASLPPRNVAESQKWRRAIRSRPRDNRASVSARRREIIDRLSSINEQILSKERVHSERIGATADKLKAVLCSYTGGVTLAPVKADSIPEIGHTPVYSDEHLQLKQKLYALLNREG